MADEERKAKADRAKAMVSSTYEANSYLNINVMFNYSWRDANKRNRVPTLQL